jgi:hypothetical protein
MRNGRIELVSLSSELMVVTLPPRAASQGTPTALAAAAVVRKLRRLRDIKLEDIAILRVWKSELRVRLPLRPADCGHGRAGAPYLVDGANRMPCQAHQIAGERQKRTNGRAAALHR